MHWCRPAFRCPHCSGLKRRLYRVPQAGNPWSCAGISGFPELGIVRKKPAAAIREMIEVVRALLKGETVNFQGDGLHGRGDIDRARLAQADADRDPALLQALACGITPRHGSNGSMRTLRVR
jgi:hypothetical protein